MAAAVLLKSLDSLCPTIIGRSCLNGLCHDLIVEGAHPAAGGMPLHAKS